MGRGYILKTFFFVWFLPASLGGTPLWTLQAEPSQNVAPIPRDRIEAELKRQRDALRRSPEYKTNSPEVHLKLGNYLSQQGDPTGALEEYKAALLLDPDSASAYRGIGVVLLDKHEWTGAVEALQATVRLDNQDEKAYFWLGRGLMAQRDFPPAEVAFEHAIRLNPNEAELFADLGLVRMGQGKVKAAFQALQSAIQLKPDYSDAHYLLEVLQASPEDPEKVRQAALDVLKVMMRVE